MSTVFSPPGWERDLAAGAIRQAAVYAAAGDRHPRGQTESMTDILGPIRASARRLKAGLTASANRRAARFRPFAPRPRAFAALPEPQKMGSFGDGVQLMAGEFRFAGSQISAPRRSIWDLPAPDLAFSDALHGFDWADDLVAVGDAAARRQLQSWLMDWVRRYGSGQGPGWRPSLTGRRLIRWVGNAGFVQQAMDAAQAKQFLASSGRQAAFLRSRWRRAATGLPRFEALCGLVAACVALDACRNWLAPSVEALGGECARQIDATGGIATRNPEELNRIFSLLTWTAQAVQTAGTQPDPRHLDAMVQIGQTLRSLRMGDGTLARFHGGGPGLEGQLDRALADAGVKGLRREELAMGFARLNAGRTLLVMDCAAPPKGPASETAQASTLAFEMSSGRRRLIVNCGPGAGFGADHLLRCRTSAAQSGVSVERGSSSRTLPGMTHFTQIPTRVEVQRAGDLTGNWIQATQNGFEPTHGLVHERRVYLASSGRELGGEDIMTAPEGKARARYTRSVAGAPKLGIMFTLHFHLHPEVDAVIDASYATVTLTMKSGEVWLFRQHGGDMTLADSLYYEPGQSRPQATRQILVTGRVVQYSGDLTWSMLRIDEGVAGTRDLLLE